MVAYEEQLNRDGRWALLEGSMHFERESAVHKTMQSLAKTLERLQITYAVVGGMALFLHGYRRFTEDGDLLVTADGLKAIHEQLAGRGYLPVYEGSRNLRDTDNGVRIEFLVTGQFPGDGKPKPVAFPLPDAASQEIDGIRCLDVVNLVQLKLASGTGKGRRKDLGDVQEMIRHLSLPRDLVEQLDESVRAMYLELWDEL